MSKRASSLTRRRSENNYISRISPEELDINIDYNFILILRKRTQHSKDLTAASSLADMRQINLRC